MDRWAKNVNTDREQLASLGERMGMDMKRAPAAVSYEDLAISERVRAECDAWLRATDGRLEVWGGTLSERESLKDALEDECGGMVTISSGPFRRTSDRPAICLDGPAHANHPPHYGGADNPYEAIKVIEAWELGFNLGNVAKYIARAGKKEGAVLVEDLEKALFYLKREIAKARRT